MESLPQKLTYKFDTANEFRVFRGMRNRTCQTRKFAQLASLSVRYRSFRGLNGWRRLTIVGLVVARLENVLTKLRFIVGFWKSTIAPFQSGYRRGRTRHDTPKQGERSPIPDPLFTFFQSLTSADHLRAKIVRPLKEILIRARKRIGLIGGIASWEAMLGFPVVLDVFSGALNEVTGQFDALVFVEAANFVFSEALLKQTEQG